MLSLMRLDSCRGHRMILGAERHNRSDRGACRLAEEDENDDSDERDEERLEVEKNVLHQDQWTREPGVSLGGFAERRSESDQCRVHRQQQPEHWEVGRKLGDGEDDGERPESERAFQDAIVADSDTIGLLELLK